MTAVVTRRRKGWTPPVRDRWRVLKHYLARQRVRVDKALDRLVPRAGAVPGLVHRAMRHSLFAGGKRLRPVLCLAAAEACGGRSEKFLPAACALELVHTYSLVHDDLPCMDDDDLRRGQPTSHKVFGEGIAVLSGDALLTLAFEIFAGNAAVPGVPAANVLRALADLARSAGTLGMVGGQVVDLEKDGSGKAPSDRPSLPGGRERALRYIHSHKTAALIRSSLRVGAVLAGAPPAKLKALDAYGEGIGLAFQIADDILDVVGNKVLLGKRGSDQDNGKLTYPAVYGLQVSRKKAYEAVGQAQAALKPFGPRGAILRDLADYVIQREN